MTSIVSIAAVSILSVLVLVLSYTTYNQYRKLVIYETWFSDLSEIVERSYSQLQKLDENEAYRNNDDLGKFYQSLRLVMKRLYKFGFYQDDKVDRDLP